VSNGHICDRIPSIRYEIETRSIRAHLKQVIDLNEYRPIYVWNGTFSVSSQGLSIFSWLQNGIFSICVRTLYSCTIYV